MLNKSITVLTMSILSIFALTACGGGGSSGTNSGNTSQPIKPVIKNPVTPKNSIKGDTTGVVGQSLNLSLMVPPSTHYDRISWKQSKGATVYISANNQSAFSFTPKSAGEYEFVATLYYNDKIVENLTQRVSVTPAKGSVASLRGDRSIGSGGTVSVRFYTPTELRADDWTLTQISGSKANIIMDKSEALANIQVPFLLNDEILVFKAVAKKDPNLTDTVSILVKAKNILPEKYFCSSPDAGGSCIPLNALTNNYAYLRNGKYAKVLTKCTMSYALNTSNFCSLNTLPYLGTDSQNPSIDDIMARVVVSHDWMAENFEKFLRQYDTNNDFKRLLRSTTAIIISDSVRPAFYWGATGAIYLDPNYLWLTAEQRDDVSEVADYRADFGNDLKFESIHDYEKNGKTIIYGKKANSYNPDRKLRTNRSLETMALPLASLLYHELAHANDYMPNENIKKLSVFDMFETPYDVQPKTSDGSPVVSDKLAKKYPLLNQDLVSLAQVVYGGQKASNTQKNFTPNQVGQWFFNDKGIDLYSFYNSREDLAMLFEETMMFSRFGVNRYMMFVDPKTLNIVQGYKNWAVSDKVKPRASFIVENILPEAYSAVKQTIDNSRAQKICNNVAIFQHYNTNCVSKALPKVNGYFYKQNPVQLPKAPTRGATPIGRENLAQS